MAAIEAANLGKDVTLLEPTGHIGGMTASGIGVTDIGRLDSLGGLTKKFFATVADIYGKNVNSMGGTIYEPHVAQAAFERMLGQTPVHVVTNAPLVSVDKAGAVIRSVTAGNGLQYAADAFIDASYEGDLMAAAGVQYVVGRESSTQYGESLNGVAVPARPYGLSIDPYVVPGTPTSGLLPHVQDKTLPSPGDADTSVMAYNYRLCVTQNPANMIPFAPPSGYDPAEFELLVRFSNALQKTNHAPQLADYMVPVPLPNGKYDLNSASFLSTDDVGESAAYPDAGAATRLEIEAEHRRYMQALLYFLQTSTRLPPAINSAVGAYGLCKDEFTDNGGWPYRIYLREGRRMVGAYVLTQNDLQLKTAISDSIGVGSFYFDFHTTNRVAVKGTLQAERMADPSPERARYPISYRALTPLPAQASNLLVTVCLSASHAAFGSLRVESTYMVMGQSAGAAASLALDGDVPVQDVSYNQLSAQLLADGQVISFEGSPTAP